MASRFHEGPFAPVTNNPMQKLPYGPLFFLRTAMLIFAFACTSVVIGLEFWATNRVIDAQNTLLNAFESSADVWVSVHDIYTTAIITAIGFCVLWVVLAVGTIMSLRSARKLYDNFGFLPFIIGVLACWILVSGAAETWFFARSNIKLIVAIDGIWIPQSEVDSVVAELGVPVIYKNTTMWKVNVAFVWITWVFAIATAIVLVVSDSESARFTRRSNFPYSREAGAIGVVDIMEDREAKGSGSFGFPFLRRRSPPGFRGDGNGNGSRVSGIQGGSLDSEETFVNTGEENLTMSVSRMGSDLPPYSERISPLGKN